MKRNTKKKDEKNAKKIKNITNKMKVLSFTKIKMFKNIYYCDILYIIIIPADIWNVPRLHALEHKDKNLLKGWESSRQ